MEFPFIFSKKSYSMILYIHFIHISDENKDRTIMSTQGYHSVAGIFNHMLHFSMFCAI